MEKNQSDCLLWLCAASGSVQCKYERTLFSYGCFFRRSWATAVAKVINSSFVHRYQKINRCPDPPRTAPEQRCFSWCTKDYFSKSYFAPNFVQTTNRTGFPPLPLSHPNKPTAPRRPARLSRPAHFTPEATGKAQNSQRAPRWVWTDTTRSCFSCSALMRFVCSHFHCETLERLQEGEWLLLCNPFSQKLLEQLWQIN